jgi:hypothetical protein
MEFKKYMHIERFGTSETHGIELGLCYVFPKIDGTNASVWRKDYDSHFEIKSGSRNRELTVDNDNAGFCAWVSENSNLNDFFYNNSSLRLYGEWLVPHTLKTYEEKAWRNFYVFDVMDGNYYLPYEVYKPLLEKYNIDYIPPICKVKNPTYERLNNQLEKNGYLIKDGEGTGEGIVIKNYDYKNKYGRVVWAKIVKNDFKLKHQKASDVCEIKESKTVEEIIVKKYVNSVLVEKEFSKIENEAGWSSKFIPRLLNTVFYCLIKEESWNFIKENKFPRIDFTRLNQLTIQKIKELKPEILYL